MVLTLMIINVILIPTSNKEQTVRQMKFTSIQKQKLLILHKLASTQKEKIKSHLSWTRQEQ